MGPKITKVMVKSTLNKTDWAVRYLPYSVLKQICTKLNIRSQFFDDFRMVAEQTLSKLFSVFPILNFSTEIVHFTRFLRRSIFSEQILSILVA